LRKTIPSWYLFQKVQVGKHLGIEEGILAFPWPDTLAVPANIELKIQFLIWFIFFLMDKSRILMQKRRHRELTKGTPEELHCELKRSKIQKSCEKSIA
jgi:hypothetical protein